MILHDKHYKHNGTVCVTMHLEDNYSIIFTENCENDSIYLLYIDIDIIRIIYREAHVDIENSNIREPT